MLPRSDRFYVGLVIGAAALLVIISIIAAVRTLSGDAPKRPAYESAPAAALVKQPSESIIDPTGVSVKLPPIDDDSYLTLHRGTRLLALALMRPGWEAVAQQQGATYEATRAIRSQVKEVQGLVAGSSGRPQVSGSVRRPGLQARGQAYDLQDLVDTTVTLPLVDQQGQSAGTVSYTLRAWWRLPLNRSLRATAPWQIYQMELSVDSSGPESSVPENNLAG